MDKMSLNCDLISRMQICAQNPQKESTNDVFCYKLADSTDAGLPCDCSKFTGSKSEPKPSKGHLTQKIRLCTYGPYDLRFVAPAWFDIIFSLQGILAGDNLSTGKYGLIHFPGCMGGYNIPIPPRKNKVSLCNIYVSLRSVFLSTEENNYE